MINVNVRLVDFMDSTPISNAEIEVMIKVTPWYKVTFDTLKPKVESVPGTGEILPSIKGMSREDGAFSCKFDVNEAFARQWKVEKVENRNKILPNEVFASLTVRVRGLTFHLGVELARDASVTDRIPFDFAKAIVGDTKTDSTALWFCLHPDWEFSSTDRYHCEIRKKFPDPILTPPSPGLGLQASGISKPVIVPPRTIRVEFEPDRVKTAVVPVDKLQPATTYTYALVLREEVPVPLVTTLTKGEFTTAPATSDHLSFVFSSCHMPTLPASLERWETLANRRDYDLMLLIGDQIYEDGLEPKNGNWFESYKRRYHQYWQDKPMREVLRRTPTYMVWDDHEIRDDWGGPDYTGKFPSKWWKWKEKEFEKYEDQFNDAKYAYQIFQQAHNPGGYDGTFHYSFQWGAASFFVMDSRGERGKDANYPILGEPQRDAIKAWAYAEETRESDIIFFIAPVPIAFLLVDDLLRLRGELEKALIDHWEISADSAKEELRNLPAYDLTEEGIMSWLDLADQWTWTPNQVDLKWVLELLFDLANDIQQGGRLPERPRRRAVFILGGDVHVGAMHKINSKKRDVHQQNPVIYQLISSPISRDPNTDDIYLTFVRHYRLGKHITTDDLPDVAWDPVRGKQITEKVLRDLIRKKFSDENWTHVPLDSGENFETEIVGLRAVRNFGRVAVEKIKPDGRVYRIKLSIEGEGQKDLYQIMELDLDAEQVKSEVISMRSLFNREDDIVKSFRKLLTNHSLGLEVGLRKAYTRVYG